VQRTEPRQPQRETTMVGIWKMVPFASVWCYGRHMYPKNGQYSVWPMVLKLQFQANRITCPTHKRSWDHACHTCFKLLVSSGSTIKLLVHGWHVDLLWCWSPSGCPKTKVSG
jgi:hypothetical protein